VPNVKFLLESLITKTTTS